MILSELTPPLARFGWVDWLVVAGYLLLTTVIGAALSGRPSTIRDFFLGGRKLPWWAICGSIIATEISAATIVGVPTISFAPGGNLTYLQLALGSILARVIIARYFVARYYEQEIYSPYDYVGTKLGPRVRQTTTGLFFVGAVLGQGTRLFITAFVLSVVAGLPLTSAIWVLGAFAAGWTLIGGMVTVIWTDVIQFIVVVIGAIVALIASIAYVPGSLGEVVRVGTETGKFQVFDLSLDPSIGYTLWCGLIALPFLNLAAFGTDQVMAQRFFCCRTQSDARKAMLWSNLSLLIPVLMLGVGIALSAYFRHNPFTVAEETLMQEDKNYLLPIFVVRQLPLGIRGLVVAAIFAAAISTLQGALTALSQASVGLIYAADRLAEEEAKRAATGRMGLVLLSKLLVVSWTVALCMMAIGCITIAKEYRNVIDLALSLARYTYGPLLGIFLLAFLRRPPTDAGLFWAVLLAVMAVLSMSLHGLGKIAIDRWSCSVADGLIWAGAAVAAIIAAIQFRRNSRKLGVVIATCVAVVLLHYLRVGTTPEGTAIRISPFWHYPIATLITFLVGYYLGIRRENENAR